MIDPICRKFRHILRFFAFCFFLTFRCCFQSFRFRSVQITNSFCFIKKHKGPIHFDKAHLLGILHFFRGTSKTVFITYDQLLHHRLHLGIKGMQIGTDLF